jgi:hypothetical protein
MRALGAQLGFASGSQNSLMLAKVDERVG